MDKNEIKRRYLKSIATSPITFLPVMTGVSVSFITWAIGMPLLWPAAIAGILISSGIFAQRIIFPSDKTIKKLQEDIEKELNEQRQSQLEDLSSRLSEDGDVRTDKLLFQVTELVREIQINQDWKTQLDGMTVVELMKTVNKIFDSCVSNLEQTLSLKSQADGCRSKGVRETYLKKRESLIKDVQESINSLQNIFIELQGIKQDNNLSNLREKLHQTLEIGKTVQNKLNGLHVDIKEE